MGVEQDVIKEMQSHANEAIAALKNDLAKLRTGRASASILDNIRVDYYGNPTPLNQCAAITVPDARMLLVKPWEKNILPEIEKAILHSDVGITPQNDGENIRLPIPPLNEERRKDLTKQARSRGEDAKISLRNSRRDANEMLKELEKEKEISQDDLKRSLEKIQGIVDKANHDIDAILETKEQEIMEV